jgi:hypothetical protein
LYHADEFLVDGQVEAAALTKRGCCVCGLVVAGGGRGRRCEWRGRRGGLLLVLVEELA